MIDVRKTSGANVSEFRGSSEEEKPTLSKDCRPGSIFYEWDTGDLYMFDGEEWLMQGSGSGGGGGAVKSAICCATSTDGGADLQVLAAPNQFYTGPLYPNYYITTAMDDGGFPDVATQVFSAGKGDVLYLTIGTLQEGHTLQSVQVDFVDPGADDGNNLLEVDGSDFSEGDECVYVQVTIPDTDLDGNDWEPGYQGIIIFSANIDDGGEDVPSY